MKKYLVFIFVAIFLITPTAYAQLNVQRPSQGGTGIGTAAAGDVGKCLSVSTASPFTYVFGTCSGGSGGGSGNVSTSTSETATYVPFWTTTSATPAALSGGDSGFSWDNIGKILSVTHLLSTSSSTLQNFTAINATTSQATSTSFAATTICLTGDTCRTTWPTGGGSANTDKWATSTDTRYIQPNAALGTIVGLSTTTNATTTSQYVSGPFIANGSYMKGGNAASLNPCTGLTCFEFWGDDNTTNGVQMGVGNRNAGTSAYGGLFFNNNLSDSSVTHYGFIGYNSSTYSDSTFGTGEAVPNLMYLQSTDGPISLIASTSTSPGYINFLTGGATTGNERMRITKVGNVGIGTTTPPSRLTIATSTAYTAAFPDLLIGPSGLSSGSANGTLIGANTHVFTGNLIDLQNTGTSEFKVTGAGALTALSTITSTNGGLSICNVCSAGFAGRAKLQSSADGLIELLNAAGTGFTRLNFGGSTSSFPAFARSSTDIALLLADGTQGGRLGIGVTPSFTLDVNSGATQARIERDNTGSGGADLLMDHARGTASSRTIVAQDDELGTVSWRGYDGANFQVATYFRGFIDGTPGSGDMPGRLSFFTTPDGTATSLERLTIKNTGNIGVGTTTPPSRLTVATSTTYTAAFPDLLIGSNGLSSGNANGTLVGANTQAGFTGDFLKFQLNGTAVAGINATAAATFNNGVAVNNGSTYSFSARTSISAPNDGDILFTNSAANDFGRLKFGGATSAFPALNKGTQSLSVTGANGGTTSIRFGIGTTTPAWALQVASTTGPQLTLSDPTVLTNDHWSFRNAGGTLYIASSSAATFATSTTPEVTFATNGNIGISSSTPWTTLSIDRGTSASSSIAVSEYRYGATGTLATSTSATIDCRTSNTIAWPLGTSATTLTLSGLIPGQSCKVIVHNPNGTAGALTWAVTSGQILLWANKTTPTQTTTANTIEVWSFLASTGSSTQVVLGNLTPNF